MTAGAQTLVNDQLEVTVLTGLGGTIDMVRHVPTGASVLGTTPWDRIDLPEPSGIAPDEQAWLSRFGGGWPVMFPNAGDACEVDGLRHGFHGEASVTPWQARRDGGALVLTRRLLTAPVRMERRLTLDGARLVVEETIAADAPALAVWGQHVTFGSDLLDGPVEITTSARRVAACASYDPAANPLKPGAAGDWPLLPGRGGPDATVDLSRPAPGWAASACLMDLGAAPWAMVCRPDAGLAARLDWTADPWPLAWLWVELGGTTGGPWFGRARLLGIEPCTTWPSTGMANARRAGGAILSLAAGEVRKACISLAVSTFEPTFRGPDAR